MVDEVRAAIRKLQNAKTSGYDGVKGELSKYGEGTIVTHMTETFNKIFAAHSGLDHSSNAL